MRRLRREPEEEPAALRHIAAAGFALGGVAFVLAFPKYGEPVAAQARQLMVPAGLLLVPIGVWHARHRSTHIDWGARWPHGLSAAFFLSIAAALLGGGLDYVDQHAPWLVLMVPCAASMSYLAYWLAFDEQARTAQGRWIACLGAIMFALVAAWLAVSDLA